MHLEWTRCFAESDILVILWKATVWQASRFSRRSPFELICSMLTGWNAIREYIFIVKSTLHRFPCGMFSCNILGCSFSHGWLSTSRVVCVLFYLYILFFFSFLTGRRCYAKNMTVTRSCRPGSFPPNPKKKMAEN